jgi:hypothetical protein
MTHPIVWHSADVNVDRQEQEVIETLRGVGRIWRKSKVAVKQAAYRIDISRTIHVTRGVDAVDIRTPGLATIGGTLLSEVPEELIGQPIELEVKDGRRWKSIIQSEDGTIVNRFGIF